MPFNIMEDRTEPIFDFDLEMIESFFIGLDRQGPGGDAQTRLALELCGDLPSGAAIADIGCGTGAQTAVLATADSSYKITATDLLPKMVEGVKKRMARLEVNNVEAFVADMCDLPFKDEQFDLLWAEGSIYNVGFGEGLRRWHRLLKPGGMVAVTECSWLSSLRPDDTGFTDANFPDIASIPEKLAVMELAGYSPVAHFILPKECWSENYYIPAQARTTEFLKEYPDNPQAEKLVELMHEEVAYYERYGHLYGYVFYIGRKQ